MNLNVQYYANEGIGERFYSHFLLGVKEDIGEYDKNSLEKMGDTGLWMVEKFPGKVLKNPKVLAIGLAALAMLGVSFAFYPSTIKVVISALPTVSTESIRFITFIGTIEIIVSATLRAAGRFLNRDLMTEFYRYRF